MDDVLFGSKRAYWASAGFAARKLAKYGITPARLNLLRVIYAGPGRRVSQRYVRHHLGVARSTVCRMIRALEALGLVVRDGSRLQEDKRTLMCELTLRGRQLVATIYSELVHTKVIARAIDAIWPEPQTMRVAAKPIFAGLALSFGRWGPVCAP
jgi:DNA-binding MarR family transcriptional regulator